jgi:sugar O-acyltransferase (sialic acid O-acetyltransferase NeuD family)
MIFYGASGHAKVVIESWIASGGKITCIVDDNSNIKNLLGHTVQGPFYLDKFPGIPVVISIGSNTSRKKITEKLQSDFGKIVHPSAVFSPSSTIGDGTVVMAGVIINADTRIGRHVIINSASVVEHDCRIDDFVHISPNATICGGIEIGEGTHIGAGATVIQGKRIGRWAVIGAGSVIIEDVPDFAVVTGVPGKVKKFLK